MKPVEFIKNEISDFKKSEIISFVVIISLVTSVSLYSKDSFVALISAICGICYTIFAGYGKVYCYLTGMLGTFCYCYLAYRNGFWGNLCLYGLYYFPMEVIGIFQWKKNLKKNKNEIIKTKLNSKERFLYLLLGLLFTLLLFLILKSLNGKNPVLDSFITVFSIIGQLLTVKRCVEQWYIWFFVNLASLVMWIYAVLNGADCTATVLMWGIYLILSIYFLRRWNREIKKTGE